MMFCFRFISFLFFTILFIRISAEENAEDIQIEHPESHSERKTGSDHSLQNPFDFKTQRIAIQAWGKQLTESDTDPSAWKKQPQYMFDHYIHVLSDIFRDNQAKVNFVLVGACDGTHDITISKGYLPNSHWRGAFVEPFEINFNDLQKFMKDSNVLDRTHLIHAAATSKCNSTTIKMKRPTFEEKNKSLPHWMRREIGAVVPFDKLDRPATGGWIFEYVRCVNGPEILKDWANALAKSVSGTSKSHKVPIRMRPHILKVDVEGHDYDVLSGFIADDVPTAELPLLISFEAKSIAKKFDLLKAQMEKRGYAMSSHVANDGFAILKPNIFLKGKKKHAHDNAENEYVQKIPNPDEPEAGKKRKGGGKLRGSRKGKKRLRGD